MSGEIAIRRLDGLCWSSKAESDENAPGGVADDEDDHDQQQDGRVVPVPGAALPTVDREEDADVEEDEKQQRHHAQEHQSGKVIVDISILHYAIIDIGSAPDPVLVDDDVPLVHPELCHRDVCLAVRGPPDRALQELGDVDQGRDEQDRQDVAEQVPGVAPVQ